MTKPWHTIDSRVLMNSWANRSEILLSKPACNFLNNKRDPRVLIGGLGMGCTLKAALATDIDRVPVLQRELAILRQARKEGGCERGCRKTAKPGHC